MILCHFSSGLKLLIGTISILIKSHQISFHFLQCGTFYLATKKKNKHELAVEL